jgi:glutaminase
LNLGLDIAAKYDFIFNFIQKMAGSYHLDFNNSMFLSERRSCDRNSALAHFMLENKCLPAGIEIKKIIDLYCQVIFSYFSTLIVPMYLIFINLYQQIKKENILFQKLF